MGLLGVLMSTPANKVEPHPLLPRARRLAVRGLDRLLVLLGKPGVRTGLVLVALAVIGFNAVFFHIAAMPEGLLHPATDEYVVIQPAYQVYLNGELPPQTYVYGPVLPLLLGHYSVVVSLLRVAVFGLPIKTLAGVDATELVFYGRLWNAGIMALASLLVYWIAYRATGRRTIGLCVALIYSFGSYIMRLAKPDATVGLFGLAAVALSAIYVTDRRFWAARISLALATGLMVLAFFTKYTAAEFMLILPFAVVLKGLRERREHPAWVSAVTRDLLIAAAAGVGVTLLIGQVSFLKNKEHYQAFTASLINAAALAYQRSAQGHLSWTDLLRVDFWQQRLHVYAAATTGSNLFAFLCLAAAVRYLFSRQAVLSILSAGTLFNLLRAINRPQSASDVQLIAAGMVILGSIFVFELAGWLTLLVAWLARRRPAAAGRQRLAVLAGAVFSGAMVFLICVSAIRTQDLPHYALSRAVSQVLEQCPGLRPQQVWFGVYDDRDFSAEWMKGVHFYTTYGADSTEKMLAQAAPLRNVVLVLRPLDPDPRVSLLTFVADRIWLAGNYTVLEFGDVHCVPNLSAQEIAVMSGTKLGRVFGRLNDISLAYKRALYSLLPPGIRPAYWPRNVVLAPSAFASERYDSLANWIKRALAAPDQYANTLAVLRGYYAAHSTDDSPQLTLLRDSDVAAGTTAAGQDNTIANSSFEQTTHDGAGERFVGWEGATFWNPAQAQGNIRSTGGYQTATALELEMTGARGSPDRIGVQQACGAMAAGTALLLQADLNLPQDMVNAAARVDVVLYQPEATSNYSILSLSRTATTGGWHTLTAIGQAPAAAGQYSCMLVAQIVATGPVAAVTDTARFDNLVLRQTAKGP
jgi:hypothetical protein